VDQIVPENVKQTEPSDATLLKNHRVNIHFPWLSIFASFLLIVFFVITVDQELSLFYGIENNGIDLQNKVSLLIILGLIYLLDIRFFLNKKSQVIAHINNLNNQLTLLSQSKKKQQQRANTYSDHSEKLKTFISDKLLEYMEYDEKFIHFKGIASEVRHNGVISYDKVVTALNKAVEQQKFLALYEQTDNDESEPDKHTIDALMDYQSALDAMRYLWDLLDLSTADNMSLHIGNQLIDCEEQYFQLQLDSQKSLDITQSIPVSPTFYPQMAILMTFALISDELEIKNLIALAKINELILDKPFTFDNQLFHISLESTPELLGNHNHIILLLENLIKNAQFFVNKNRFKQKTDRIIVRLFKEDNFAHFSIYNRGPQINPDAIEEIFKLGFSTRNRSSTNNKQHHGKGLGLFFASEIVKGYQGSIEATNIENIETGYLLSLNLASGETLNHKIKTAFIDGKMNVKQENESQWSNELVIQPDIPIESISIIPIELNGDKEGLIELEHTTGPIDESEGIEWLEPAVTGISQWFVQLKAFKNVHKLTFKPLDINGVCFDIKIPTAKSHLELT